MVRRLRVTALLLLGSTAGALSAQSAPALGVWRGCFSAEGYRSPVCGDVLLDSARACRVLGTGYGEGYYTIAFDSLNPIQADGTTLSLPDRQAGFTWEQTMPDSIHVSRRAFPTEDTEGRPLCRILPETSFEMRGHLAGDTLNGEWVWYGGDHAASRVIGRFVLRRDH